ncbi:MAG TPA: hypothetical protein VHL34_24650 [Rhizomicrobium sp.]|jgi:hypothetical protein|nr:hypothetical protein [Rhizomicrobium sp.]
MGLTQEELNAATFIRGLVDLCCVNINPQYGYGRETMDLIRQHVRGWDYRNRRELREIMERVIAECELPEPATSEAQ